MKTFWIVVEFESGKIERFWATELKFSGDNLSFFADDGENWELVEVSQQGCPANDWDKLKSFKVERKE